MRCDRCVDARSRLRHLRCLWLCLWPRDGTSTAHYSGMAALSPPLGRILDLGVCVALVGMPEPSRALLLAADERNPFVTATTKPFPYIGVAVHAPRLLGLLEWTSGRRADAVCKALVVPESRVLQHEPPARFANTAPPFALVSMATHPLRRVPIAFEPELLFMRDEVWI